MAAGRGVVRNAAEWCVIKVDYFSFLNIAVAVALLNSVDWWLADEGMEVSVMVQTVVGAFHLQGVVANGRDAVGQIRRLRFK